jgi:hypothetical protein
MEFRKAENILSSILAILKHIDEVQCDVMELSERSAISFHHFLEQHSLPPDEKVLQAFQYQDVMKQQLSAVSEAIITIEQSITIYLHALGHDEMMLGENIDKLSAKLMRSLQVAKDKKEAFSGNALEVKSSESIEFFE